MKYRLCVTEEREGGEREGEREGRDREGEGGRAHIKYNYRPKKSFHRIATVQMQFNANLSIVFLCV